MSLLLTYLALLALGALAGAVFTALLGRWGK